jgi:choline dehydrogenase-like flavoprotein
MIVDAQTLAPGAEVEADVCIIGGGPAGLTLAQELIGTPHRICLIESGGLEPEAASQDLGRLAAGEGNVEPGETAVRRQLGGLAHVWNVLATPEGRGVRYRGLDPIDLEARPWLPHSGWPFAYAHLASFYARAQQFCRVHVGADGAGPWETPQARAFPLDPAVVTTTIEHFGRAEVFTHDAREALRRAPNVTVLLHATATELQEEPPSTAVRQLVYAAPDGLERRVRAVLFVLAVGPVENARLLLLSNRTRPAGLGNQHDLVGRFFMDHHNVRSGFLVPASPALFETAALYDLRQVNGALIMAKLAVADPTMRKEQLLSAAARLQPKRVGSRKEMRAALRSLIGTGDAGPVDATRRLAAAVLKASLSQAPRHFYGWSELRWKQWRYDAFQVELRVEVTPDAANRVMLGRDQDRLGRPRAAIRWRWGAADLASLRRVQEILASELARAGLGVLELPRADAPPDVTMPGGIHHQSGTTRMHVDPRQGVVDADGRVHDVPNLFVAGSSVFPTCGAANPTLTVVALTLRLADHLRRVLARGA